MERNLELCARIETDLLLYVGGELDPTSARAVATHLETCGECRAREVAARSTQEARAHALRRVQGPGPDLWPALRAELAREGRFRNEPTVPAPVLVRRAAPGWWWAAAAAIVLFGAWAVRAVVDRGLGGDVVDPGKHLVDEVRPVTPRTIVAEPVSDGLRRLGQDELSLEDGALLLGEEFLRPMPTFRSDDPRIGSPAGLQRVQR